MFALKSRVLRRRLSAPTSGSARRRAWERARAKQTREEGERLARERREIRARDKLEQQRQALTELKSYEPWGRAGGGAPNPYGVRFTDLRASEIYPEDELRGVSQFYEPNQRWRTSRLLRRTPLRLREDPETCYADNLRRAVDIDIRYRQTPEQQRTYKQILDEMVESRKKATRDDAKRNLDSERKMHTMAGPWGKPGPGGVIWRNPRNIGSNFARSMGWTNNEIFNNIKGDHRSPKRSSLTLPQVKRDDDCSDVPPGIENDKAIDAAGKLPEITSSGTKDKCHEENNKSNTGVKKKTSVTYDDNIKTKRTSNGKSKFIKRLSNGDRMKRIVPDIENAGILNSNAVREEKKPTPEAAILRLTGGVELVPLLARRRRVGARTLHSSDVTRTPEQDCQWRNLLQVEYLRELKNQMRVKCIQKEERQRDSAASVRQHHETWASLWGRPGHGAPLPRGRYARSNLAHLLYVPPAPLGNTTLYY